MYVNEDNGIGNNISVLLIDNTINDLIVDQ